jgi:hypothetical protein
MKHFTIASTSPSHDGFEVEGGGVAAGIQVVSDGAVLVLPDSVTVGGFVLRVEAVVRACVSPLGFVTLGGYVLPGSVASGGCVSPG